MHGNKKVFFKREREKKKAQLHLTHTGENSMKTKSELELMWL
jgi:hypothetical protein